MSRRPAVTLIEVLVAIFVMGIGLLALLTLFPIGIISMAQAIQDERCLQCSYIAAGYANAVDIRHDPWVIQDWPLNAATSGPYPTGNLGGNDPSAAPNQVIDAYTNPNPLVLAANADANGPSYPLFIDPIGFYTAALPPSSNWVGGQVGALARRRPSFTRGYFVTTTSFNPFPTPLFIAPGVPMPTPPYSPGTAIPTTSPIAPQGAAGATAVPPYPQSYPYPPPPPSATTQALLNESLISTMFTLWDDVTFDNTNPLTPGIAATIAVPGTTPTVLRDTRFSWAYLCQRPQNGVTATSVASMTGTANRNNANGSTAIVNLTVVVFNKRPLALGTSLSLPEYVYSYNPGNNPATPNPAIPPASPSLSNSTYFDPTNNLITIDYTNAVPPPVRPGDWILDATQAWTVNQTSPTNGTYTPHGTFYRVVSVNEFQDTLTTDLLNVRSFAQFEVQTPLRGFTDSTGAVSIFPVYANPNSPTMGGGWTAANGWKTGPPTPNQWPTGLATKYATVTNGNLGYAGTSIVFDGVVRVFEIGAGRNR